MNELVSGWMAKADACEKEAARWDDRRNLNSKYYTAMDKAERDEFNRCRDAAHELRVQRNVYRECARRLREWFRQQGSEGFDQPGGKRLRTDDEAKEA